MKKTLAVLLLSALAVSALSGCLPNRDPVPPANPYVAGAWEDGIYTSEFLGFQFALPEDWTVADDAALADMEDQAEEALKQQLGGASREAWQIYHYTLSAEGPDGVSGVIVMARQDEAEVDDLIRALDRGAGDSYVTGETFTATLGSGEYTAIPVTVPDEPAIQRQYFRREGAYMVNILMFAPADDPAVFNDLEACFSAAE